MDKIKAFFQNTIVQIVAWCLLIASCVALFIGGTSLDSMSKGLTLTIAIVDGVSLLVTFIVSMIKKKE